MPGLCIFISKHILSDSDKQCVFRKGLTLLDDVVSACDEGLVACTRLFGLVRNIIMEYYEDLRFS